MTYGKSWAGLESGSSPYHGNRERHAGQLFDGGQFHHVDAALEHGRRLAAEALISGCGGESTPPGAAVSREDELARVLPVVEGLCC